MATTLRDGSEAPMSDQPHPTHSESAGKHRMVYEVVCTYEIEADSKAAAARIAQGIARTLSRTGVTRSVGPDGFANLRSSSARFKRNA